MTAQTYERNQRILTSADFRRAFRLGRRGHAKGMTVYVAPAPGERSRLGMAVSRKFGNAVARNRARRLLREAFRSSPLTADEPPIDVVVIPRGETFPNSPDSVRKSLLRAIEVSHSSTPGKGPRKKGKKR